MVKSLLVASSLLIAQAQPVFSPDRSLLEYAVTQGGLLLFTLVLLYFYRRDHQLRENRDTEKIDILVDLVSDTKTAISESRAAIATNSDVIRTQAQAIQQLVRVVEKIEERRVQR